VFISHFTFRVPQRQDIPPNSNSLELGIIPTALLVRDQVEYLVIEPGRKVVVALPRRRDQMLADHLLLAPLRRRLRARRAKLALPPHILGAHPTQNEVGLVGHAHNVVLAGVRQQPALVDQLDEREARVLLQRGLPLLGAQQHDELDHRARLLEGREAG